MGKISRGGYVILWWKADHEPRHVHVMTSRGRPLGRIDLVTLRALEGWTPSRKLLAVIKQLKEERSI